MTGTTTKPKQNIINRKLIPVIPNKKILENILHTYVNHKELLGSSKRGKVISLRKLQETK